MRINVEMRLPNSSPDQVVAMLVDEPYLNAVCARLDAVSSAVVEENERDGNEWTTAVRWVAPTRLPRILKKYESRAPATVSWLERTVWDLDEGLGILTVSPDVPPNWTDKYESSGALHLRPSDGGVTLSQTMEFRLNIGIVGKALEKMLQGEVESLLERRLAILKEFCSG